MNYTKLYYNILSKRQKQPPSGYVENHHILPACLGGTFAKSNMIMLSAREHFICHYLLTKMFPLDVVKRRKMVHAFMMMRAGHENKRYVNSRLYCFVKQRYSKQQRLLSKGKGNSQYGSMWIYNLELELTKKIKKTEKLPKGWQKGRVLDFTAKKKKIALQGTLLVKDKEGVVFRVKKTDSRFLSGELVRTTKGYLVACDSAGKTYRILNSDPRFLSGELQCVSKGKVTVKDSSGMISYVSVAHPKYLSGELVHMHKGTLVVRDKQGITFRVSLQDPRYLSGELQCVNKRNC